MTKRLIWVILAALLPLAGYAVTKEEMEQARTVTAQLYLRWANNGSGYLDELKPATMSQLEKSLKATEKENLKAFKAVGVPSGYEQWDKAAAVKYWSETFFRSPGLSDKGRAAAGRVKSRLQKMEFSAPSKKEEPKKDDKADKATADAEKADAVAKAASAAAEAAADSSVAQLEESVISEAVAADSVIVDEAVEKRKSSSSSVWIYVVALCVLIGVVVWLVIFASKTMKNTEDYQDMEKKSRRDRKRGAEEEEADEPAPVTRVSAAAAVAAVPDPEADAASLEAASVSDSRLREKYAESLARKNEEIRKLNRQIIDLREECFRLGEENGRLTSELETSRRRISGLEANAAAAAAAAAVTPAPAAEETLRRRRPSGAREIFLGRVNSKGLFVRADREFTPGKSVYRLTTTDGFTGSYRVVEDDAMADKMLDNPDEWLAGGCVAKDIENTDGMMEVITESAGTAVFEEGCWRVLRKAKISYR